MTCARMTSVMTTTSIPFKRGGFTNLVLNYASSKKTSYITVDGVSAVFGARAEKPSRVMRSIQTLCNHGLLKQVGDSKWGITTRGTELLCRIAVPNNRTEV